MIAFDLKSHLDARAAAVAAALDGYLPASDTPPERLHAAMRYSIQAGGKRLRPALVMDACACLGQDPERALPTACAIECIHTYSLIHDDLPCMDDDDLRRGRPSCHREFDEATALLAGDALQALAFQLTAENGTIAGVTQEMAVQVTVELATASGAPGMVGGQMLDLLGEHELPTAELVARIHEKKTTALLRCAVRCGALLGGADEAELAVLTEYGEALGTAFQIIDDILDIEGDPQTLGKPVGSDLVHQKATYPAVYGIDASRQKAREQTARALQALQRFGPEAEPLRAVAVFNEQRRS